MSHCHVEEHSISKTITEVESQRQSTQIVGKHSHRANLMKNHVPNHNLMKIHIVLLTPKRHSSTQSTTQRKRQTDNSRHKSQSHEKSHHAKIHVPKHNLMRIHIMLLLKKSQLNTIDKTTKFGSTPNLPDIWSGLALGLSKDWKSPDVKLTA